MLALAPNVSLAFAPGTLAVDPGYEFTVTVSKGKRNATAYVTITVVANAVPLDEWPTYIFTRVFAGHANQDAHERQMAALKAAVKHQKEAAAALPPPEVPTGA